MSPVALSILLEMGFEQENIEEALLVCRNNPSVACEWLCGDREGAVYEAETGFPRGSAIVKTLIDNPHFQQGLESPKMFMGKLCSFQWLCIFVTLIVFWFAAFLSILSDYKSISRWFQDSETSRNIIHMLNTFYEEKQIQSMHRISMVMSNQPLSDL